MNKRYIIKSNDAFLYVIKNGKKLYSPFCYLYYLKAKEPKFGISVSKKVSNLAVVRNKKKRQIKAIISQNFDFKKKFEIVIIVKKEILNAKFSEILSTLLVLFNKIR